MSKLSDGMFRQISESFEQDKKVRVHFKDATRSPIKGRFVFLDDMEELKVKNLARFIPDSKEDGFESANDIMKPRFTTMYNVEQLFFIKILQDGI